MGVIVNGVEFTEKQISEMGKAGLLNIGQKNDVSSSTPNASVLHGVFPGNANQFGLFSAPGVRPQRFTALTRPRSITKLLRPERTELVNEIVEIVTGQTAGSGSNATGWCAGGALAGQLKTCQQTYPMGNFKMRSRIMPLQEVGQLRNRADIPGMIINNPPEDNPFIPAPFYQLTDDRSQMQLEFFNLGVQMERSLERELFNGVVGTDSGLTGWWKDMNSIDALVKTGYVDAITGIACPAADSTVVTWNADVGATVAGNNIVQAYTDLYYAKKDLAVTVGMEDTQFAFFMRKEAFRALTEVWACQYATYRCQTGTAGQPNAASVVDMNNLRLEMQQGQYLLIDGIPVPVVFSEGITLERLGAGTPNILRADAYLMPISWNGWNLLHLEYHDMGNQWAREMSTKVYNSAEFINNGLYLLTKDETDGCIEFTISSKMRLFLETPFLAGRIDDMSFSYSAQTRVADPATTWLYKNGGLTYRS